MLTLFYKFKLFEASFCVPFFTQPSGRLCSASPIPTAIPVFNKLLFFDFSLFCTKISHITITIIPKVIPDIMTPNPDILRASGIKSKHTIDIIKPDANERMKLKNLFETFFNLRPIIPPKCCAKGSKKQS